MCTYVHARTPPRMHSVLLQTWISVVRQVPKCFRVWNYYEWAANVEAAFHNAAHFDLIFFFFSPCSASVCVRVSFLRPENESTGTRGLAIALLPAVAAADKQPEHWTHSYTTRAL